MSNEEKDLMDSTFVTRINDLMRVYYVKQADVAQAIDVPYTTINAWRTGKRLPNAYNLAALAQYFDTSIDFLLGRTDTKGGREEWVI